MFIRFNVVLDRGTILAKLDEKIRSQESKPYNLSSLRPGLASHFHAELPMSTNVS
jgi:hypothetical protein